MAEDPYSSLFRVKPSEDRREPERRAPAARDPYSEIYSMAPAAPTAPAGRAAVDYAAMPMGEVLTRGAKAFLPSAGRALMALPSAIYNYPETIEAVKKAGVGKVVESVLEPYKAIGKAAIGDTGELKQMIAEDPFSVLSAVPVGGAVGAVGRGLGAAGTLGKVAGAPLRAAGYVTSKVSDPLGTIGGMGAGVAGLGPAFYRRARAVGTGIEDYPFEMAYRAGAMPSGATEKAAFNQFASGAGDVQDFAQRAKDAAKSLRDKEIGDWAKSKGVMASAFTQPLPYDLVHQAIDDFRQTRLPPRQFGMESANAAHDALEKIERNILTRQLPQNAKNPINSLAGFDQLKQELWDASQRAGSDMEKNAILAAYHGVKDTLSTAAPEYQSLMDRWRNVTSNITNIEKSLGTTDKVAANAALARFVKQQKTPEGRELISQLAEHAPELPYMAAGAALHHDTARGAGGLGQAVAMSQYGPQIISSLMQGRLGEAAKGLGVAGLGLGMQSPALARNIAYTAGQLSRVPPVPQIAAASRAAEAAYPFAYPAAYQTEKMREEQAHPEAPRAYGGRTARATGGPVPRGMNAKMIVAAFEAAKRDGQNQTKQILEQPDEHVVSALEIANRHIQGAA